MNFLSLSGKDSPSSWPDVSSGVSSSFASLVAEDQVYNLVDAGELAWHQNVTNSIHCLLSGEFFLNTHETKERINADVHSTGNAPPRDYEPFSSMARFEKLKS